MKVEQYQSRTKYELEDIQLRSTKHIQIFPMWNIKIRAFDWIALVGIIIV